MALPKGTAIQLRHLPQGDLYIVYFRRRDNHNDHGGYHAASYDAAEKVQLRDFSKEFTVPPKRWDEVEQLLVGGLLKVSR